MDDYDSMIEIFFHPKYGKPVIPKSYLRYDVLKYILKELINGEIIINIKNVDIYSKLSKEEFENTTAYSRIRTKLTDAYCLTEDVYKELYERVKIFNDIKNNKYIGDVYHEHSDAVYILNTMTDSHAIADLYFRYGSHCKFTYDFVKYKDELKTFDKYDNKVQYFKIKITQKYMPIMYPIEYSYNCVECNNSTSMRPIDVKSTKNAIKCDGMVQSGERTRRCNQRLYPNAQSRYIEMYLYDAFYVDDNGEKINILCISEYDLKPFNYDAVGIVVNSDDDFAVHILAVKPVKKKVLVFNPIVTPKTISEHTDEGCYKDENGLYYRPDDSDVDMLREYVYYFDSYIEKQLGVKIVGLYDIKEAFMMQKMVKALGMSLDYNIMICGHRAVGKTLISTTYGALLYGMTFKSSNGTDISIPSLRGTSYSNRIFSTKGNKSKPGLLTQFDLVHIDEAKENPDMVQQLKSYLSRGSISNNVADGDKIERPRNAHVVVTENPQENHIGKYNGMVRKKYNSSTEHIKDADVWDDKWDLRLPLYEYDWNPYLLDAIKKTRLIFDNKHISWLDGHETAFRDRFLFNFFIDKKKDSNLNGIIEDSIKKSLANQTNGEKLDDVSNVVEKLNIMNIDEFFESFKVYNESRIYIDQIEPQLTEIMHQYGFDSNDPRLYKLCIIIANLSRIFNMRKNLNKIDFDCVRRFLMLHDRVVYLDMMMMKNITTPKDDGKDVSVVNKDDGDDEDDSDDDTGGFDLNNFGDDF